MNAVGVNEVSRHWMSAHHPVAEINRVNVLLHHLVSANPHEGVPISMLPLHVAPCGVAMIHMEDWPAEIVRAQFQHISDGAIVNFLNCLDVLSLRASL